MIQYSSFMRQVHATRTCVVNCVVNFYCELASWTCHLLYLLFENERAMFIWHLLYLLFENKRCLFAISCTCYLKTSDVYLAPPVLVIWKQAMFVCHLLLSLFEKERCLFATSCTLLFENKWCLFGFSCTCYLKTSDVCLPPPVVIIWKGWDMLRHVETCRDR